MDERRGSPKISISICQFGCHDTSTVPFSRLLKGRRKISATVSLFSYRKFGELQFMLRPVNSRKNPDFCHWGLAKTGDINTIQIPGQTTMIFHSHCPIGWVWESFSSHSGYPSSSISKLQKGKGNRKIRVEATRNCSNLALAGICKPPLSR